jgi:hypothetical protein
MHYPIPKFLEGHGQWWYVNAVFNVKSGEWGALQTITADMLHRVWDEFYYHVDVCHVTQGARIERL